MALQFKFKLHPTQWEFKGDAQVFNALRLANGDFLVTWVNENGETREIAHTSEEVLENIIKGAWVILEN